MDVIHVHLVTQFGISFFQPVNIKVLGQNLEARPIFWMTCTDVNNHAQAGNSHPDDATRKNS